MFLNLIPASWFPSELLKHYNELKEQTAELLGEDISHLSDEKAAKRGVERIRELSNSLRLAQKLKSFSISEKDIELLAHGVNLAIASNPKKMTFSDVKSVYKKVL